MCDPVSIIAGASAVVSLIAQQENADSVDASNARQYQAALTARSENANQVGLQRAQQTESAVQKVNDNNTALREAQAAVVARAGPSGLSVDALLGDLAGKGASYNQSVNANLDRVNMALDNQLTNVNRNAASEINSLRAPPAPDYLGAALKIGGAAYQGYSNLPSGYTNTAEQTARLNRGPRD